MADLGCGDEGLLADLAGKASEVIGVDERQLQGPYGRYIQADLNRDIPLPPDSVDLAASKFLIEHLEDPAFFLRQVHAALRRGGWLVLMTTNVRYYPYAANLLLSRCTRQERRMRLVELFTGRPQEEIFPVFYRCNTPRRLRRELEGAGFAVIHLGTYSDHGASAVIRPLGALAVAYEKALDLLGLEGWGGFIVAAAVKG